LTPDLSASIGLAHQMMTAMPAVPRLATTVVDVRDAADLHLRAWTHPAAAGKRFLASTGEPMSFQDVAAELRDAVGLHPTRLPVLPDDVVRGAAKTDPGMAGMVGELGEVRRVSSAKAQTVPRFAFRSAKRHNQAPAPSQERPSTVFKITKSTSRSGRVRRMFDVATNTRPEASAIEPRTFALKTSIAPT
jgi:uncharacterized protein YbjT (DUF2867 family)